MPQIRFSDGVIFDTDGPIRIEKRFDGFYVVGQGMLVPVKDRLDGEAFIAECMKPEAA